MRVIFITHNGAATSLVRSQVLPYLRGLLARDLDVELVTFERGDRYLPMGEFPPARWHPITARAGQGLLAKLVDVVAGAGRVAACVVRGGGLLHARSYLPAAIAWLIGRVLRQPYVFDMRGFLPEEYVEGGHWREGELRHRVLRIAEGRLLRDAAAIVVLTQRAAERLRTERRYSRLLRGAPIAVIPCAVDLERFRPRAARSDEPTLVYAGSLGLWYELDAMLRVYRAARDRLTALRFLVLNRDEHDVLSRAVSKLAIDSGVEVRAATFDEMPELLGRCHVGISLLRQSSSKLGSSPIKVAEYLASGLPVVVNAGQGDVDDLVRTHRAGHVLRDYSDNEIARAGDALIALLDDESARANARELAIDVFGVDEAVARYVSVYRSALAGQRGARQPREDLGSQDRSQME